MTSIKDQMNAAYGAAQRIIREEQTSKEKKIIDDLMHDDIVVVRGQYDHVEQVLDVGNIPYMAVESHALARINLRADQMLVINCPGKIDKLSIQQVRDFVYSGGSLFTTDWALKYVLEPAFSGVVEHNGNSTTDTVIAVRPIISDNPMLDGIFDENSEPQWWLERSSFPIKILDTSKVNILIDSAELGRSWGASPVVINFEYGHGEVMHMISHYYLQRTELRTKRHSKNWARYAEEKNAPISTVNAPPEYRTLNVGEVESAYTSAKFMRNSVIRHRKRKTQRTRNP